MILHGIIQTRNTTHSTTLFGVWNQRLQEGQSVLLQSLSPTNREKCRDEHQKSLETKNHEAVP